MRNQTLPWMFSWLLRGCDAVGLGGPWAYLTSIHLVLALWSSLGLWALVRFMREFYPQRDARPLAWFFALFWAFPFLYSRQLLEVVSMTPAFWLLLEASRGRAGRAGIWAGVAAFTRYPSALWAVGGVALAVYRGHATARRAALFAGGFALAFAAGGLADWATYGKFLASAGAYWDFNRPGGPVQAMFGDDSLVVYWRFFEFALTPWVAPFAIAGGAYALARVPQLAIFALPYLVGHVWTPHREPRFMIPILPLLALAIALRWPLVKWRVPRLAFVALAAIHLGLNFAWYPLNAWGQWQSALGNLVRMNGELGARPTRFVDLSDPPIDALVPKGVRWAGADCRWHRPPLANEGAARVWVLTPNALDGCQLVRELESVPDLPLASLARVLRVRTADFWECPEAALKRVCPSGIGPQAPDEPTFSLKAAASR